MLDLIKQIFIKSATGESSHALSLDDHLESDEEECDVSGSEADEPSDEVSDVEIETETETTDADTDEDTAVPPERSVKTNYFI